MTSRKLQRHGSGDSSVITDPLDQTATEADDSIKNKLQSSQYKGVVPQPNGRWGAQIYEKHQRVWLGTFNEQSAAAKAYDVAAQRFRGRDAVTNFKPLTDAAELDFLSLHSKSEIVDMLRKHTYHDELSQNKRNQIRASGKDSNCEVSSGGSAAVRRHLFDKTVTPSDVGKLNRLVIPKQHAEKHFPMGGEGGKGVLLSFEDANGKVWRFRYSYWNSSQSYVLTKGWSRFVKEKGLLAGDVVSFEECADEDDGEKKLYIDSRKRVGVSGTSTVKVFRLFGVDITEGEGSLDHQSWVNGNGKRSAEGFRGLDLFFSKQFVGVS